MGASFIWSRRQLNPSRPATALAIGLRSGAFLLLLLMLMQPKRLGKPQVVTTRRTLAVLVDSSGSMSRPQTQGGGPTRLGHAQTLIQRYRVMTQITDVANLALYGFDLNSPGLVPVKPAALHKLNAAGRQTDLSLAIRQAVAQNQSHDLAGLLVFTDGRNTHGGDPLQAAARLKVPLFMVAVGQMPDPLEAFKAESRLDLAVISANCQPRMILGRPAQLVATISADGYPARQVAVQLVRDGRVIATSSVALSPQRSKRQALFTVRPDVIGSSHYQVRIGLEANETDATNNQSGCSVEVVDPVNRLLYLDRLRFERRFLKPVLAGRKNLRYAAVAPLTDDRNLVQGNDPKMNKDAASLSAEQLRGLKVLIIGDLPASVLTNHQIRSVSQWVDDGGSLLLLGGPQSLGKQGIGGALDDLLPVVFEKPAQYYEGEYRVQLTPQGAAHPAFQRVQSSWQLAAPLLSRFQVTGVKPASSVLMTTDGTASKPLVVSWRAGHGKVAIVLADSTWRWQLAHNSAEDAADSPYTLFWTQIIDWLLPDPRPDQHHADQVQLMTDRIEYQVGDQVVMMVTVHDRDGQARLDAEVNLHVATPDGRPIKRTAVLDTVAGEGFYVAEFSPHAPGPHSVVAVANLGERTVGRDRADLKVIQPMIEFAQTDPDPQLLRDLAAQSGGAYVEPSALSDLMGLCRLAPRQVLVQPNAEKDGEAVWDRWWVLILFMAIVASEWFVRRKNQWV